MGRKNPLKIVTIKKVLLHYWKTAITRKILKVPSNLCSFFKRDVLYVHS